MIKPKLDDATIRAMSKTLDKNPLDKMIKENENKNPEKIFIKGKTPKKK
tara:strand:+ start:4092 stop:4238 length:147 start_codon:yes stop_codon:yes gene_type:complete